MAIVIETGLGSSDSEAYISVADADAYFAARGYSLWTTMSTAEKEEALRRAADYMTQAYRLRWKGSRINGTQSLDWPRNFVEREDFEAATMNGAAVIGGRYYYPSDEVPQEVKDANAFLAYKAASGDLAPDIGRLKTRVKVDVIETEYDRYAPAYTRYRAIDNMLRPFLQSTGGASFRQVVRA